MVMGFGGETYPVKPEPALTLSATTMLFSKELPDIRLVSLVLELINDDSLVV